MSRISLNDYYFETFNRIGRGSSGVVYLGYHNDTKEKVAIKRIDVSNLNEKMNKLWNEIHIMKEMEHPNVIKLYDVHIDIKNEYIYLIMEYCDSDLSAYIHDWVLDLDQIHRYLSQVKDGLYYLARKGIVHRDLKPHNLLVRKGVVKISDFGLSIMNNSGDLMQTMCGSPLYMSPEIIEHQKYTAKSDLWSIGIILYQLIYHCHPYQECKNFADLTKKIQIEPIKYPEKPPLDPLTQDLLQGLLNKNCHNRMSWDEFFHHPWFKHDYARSEGDSLELSHSLMFHSQKSLHSSPENSRDREEDEGRRSRLSNLSLDNVSMSSSKKPNLNLSQFVVDNYQKNQMQQGSYEKIEEQKERANKLYGTSAPTPSRQLEYSPSKLDFHSMGSSLLDYVSQSYNWLRASLDYQVIDK